MRGAGPSERLTAEERAAAEILSVVTDGETPEAEEVFEESPAEASEEATKEVAEATEATEGAGEERKEGDRMEIVVGGEMEMNMEERMPDPDADVNPAESDIAEAMGVLGRLNRAIDALSALHEGEVGGMANELTRLLYDLRMHRAMEFERYVDWDAVAKMGRRK